MQEQLMQAIGNAVKAGPGPASPGPSGPAPGAGRRLLAAMFKARESGCNCEPCVLLRQEVDALVGQFLQAAAEAPDPLPGAPASPPGVATYTEVITSAGNDPSA
jgi:hypothetical protein